jgi:hypothetical protein
MIRPRPNKPHQQAAEVKVTINIRPGPATPAQSAAFRKLFSRLIAECRRELKTENEGKTDER